MTQHYRIECTAMEFVPYLESSRKLLKVFKSDHDTISPIKFCVIASFNNSNGDKYGTTELVVTRFITIKLNLNKF